MRKKYLPSNECALCRKPLEETGGRRITAMHTMKIGPNNRHIAGGNPVYPDFSIKIDDDLYAYYRGPKEYWTEEFIEYLVNEIEGHQHPWICQKCANRVCNECGSPVQYLHGCDVIYDDGCSTHSAILPIQPGCTNPDCKNHK